MSTTRASSVQHESSANLKLGTNSSSIVLPGNILVTDEFRDKGNKNLFKSDGNGVLSDLNDGFSGTPNLIASNIASGSSYIEFKSDIDDTYFKYMFIFVDVHAATSGARLQFQASNNIGVSYGIDIVSTYYDAMNNEDDSNYSLSYQSDNDQLETDNYQDLCKDMAVNADDSVSGILELWTPSGTTYRKPFLSTCNQSGLDGTIPASRNAFVAGVILGGNIDAIQFKFSSGNIDAGTFKLYGVK